MEPLVLSVTAAHSGLAVERKRPVAIKLADNRVDGRSDQHPAQRQKYGVEWMVSIPVLNIPNPNQVVYIVNLLYAAEPSLDFGVLVEVGELFADKYEALLHERCFRESNLLQLDLASVAVDGTLTDLCKALTSRIAHSVSTDAVGVYLADSRGGLELNGLSISGIRTLMRFQKVALTSSERVIKSNREHLQLSVGALDDEGRFQGAGAARDQGSVVAVPMRNLEGKAIGSIVCVREFQRDLGTQCTFTYDDVTAIEALGQTFAPYHEMLFSESQRLEALSRLSHELKGPITGMRAALESARSELGGHRFSHDFLKDLAGYTDLISGLTEEFEVGTENQLELTLHRERLNLVSDLLAPTMRAVEKTLKGRGYSEGKIRRPGVSAAPRMWLDRGRMLQVIFNLLENAIKYSDINPARFSVEVTFSFENGNYEISFRDHGIGIPAGFERRIFFLGSRAPNALEKHAAGKGMGLAIARKIVRAHGGELEYRRHANGSEFVIVLPQTIVEPPS
jgi:signal transduction histidine kinase